MKILVVGSKGFIGSHVFEYFKGKGHQTFGADVIVDYTSDNYFLIDSVKTGFKDIFEKESFDLCLNCSGASSVPDSLNNPLRDFRLNATNVFEILEAIRKHNPNCKMINLSSAAVYGNPDVLPIKESQTCMPISPYGMHKLYSEKICDEFYRFFNIKTISLRIFSAFGEGLRKQLFWDLFKKSTKDNKIELFGTGKETRDFIYIKDLVSLIEKVALHAPFDGRSVNAASGQETTIKDAVNTFLSLWNPNVKAHFTGLERKGDPNRWIADVTLAKDLGFSNQYSLEKGLTNYIIWLQKEK
jgi:dTDP-glucose 4,6-dehydratase/UDP-glucose 4-epimerase